MPRERLCQYGNCESTEVKITVNDIDGMERPAFCCHEHAALWLLRRVWQYYEQRSETFAQKMQEQVGKELCN